MIWKNWPYWVRGGVIFIGLAGFALFISILFSTEFTGTLGQELSNLPVTNILFVLLFPFIITDLIFQYFFKEIFIFQHSRGYINLQTDDPFNFFKAPTTDFNQLVGIPELNSLGLIIYSLFYLLAWGILGSLMGYFYGKIKNRNKLQ